MSESSAGEVVESLGATSTIPGATTISSDLTGCVAMLATIPGRVPTVGRVGGTALPGLATRARGDRLGFIVVHAARDAASDAAALSFTKVRLNPNSEVDQRSE